MVTIATGLGRTGFQDWLIQRVTAVILTAYIFYLFWFCLSYANEMNYHLWRSLFSNTLMRYFSLAALISLIAHAWIGMWTITTDYIKITRLRIYVQFIIVFVLFISFVWGCRILWGV